ncbi:hypothetical protein [Nocardioides sp. B-3]|uniref:hypothetical protein n=1 Tax=Nocardioides sp. B-3 TaxID=2895565 RepID=UPI00215236EA|nr:hypothetical protein [Nocardioides sp. B-3]UUZ60453.1 hypothetical protein LP418_06095 [Nocardioides sp. B-3]
MSHSSSSASESPPVPVAGLRPLSACRRVQVDPDREVEQVHQLRADHPDALDDHHGRHRLVDVALLPVVPPVAVAQACWRRLGPDRFQHVGQRGPVVQLPHRRPVGVGLRVEPVHADHSALVDTDAGGEPQCERRLPRAAVAGDRHHGRPHRGGDQFSDAGQQFVVRRWRHASP